MFFHQQTIILLLKNIAIEIARSDGWASINIAGQRIKQQEPESLSLLKKQYGSNSLRALMVAMELFNIYEEPTKKGFRLLYKLKPVSELSNA